MKKIILLFTLVLCSLISCKKNDGCVGEKHPESICPDNIDYVCGCDGETYPNSCYAEREGVLSYIKGECKKKWWKRK